MNAILLGSLSALLLSAAAPLVGTGRPYSGEDITDQSLVARNIAKLQEHLRQNGLGVSILSCSSMVRVLHQGRNEVVGAICSVRTEVGARNLLLCTDDTIGDFALAARFAHYRDSLIDFAFRNCGGWVATDQSDPGNTSF
jgi:hypothetical protein